MGEGGLCPRCPLQAQKLEKVLEPTSLAVSMALPC